MAGIYLHIPFCRQACTYCDFHFSTKVARIERMVDAIQQEAGLMTRFFPAGIPIDTVYFGGGTPSLLSPVMLQGLLETLGRHYEISPGAEITLEANPEDLGPAQLARLKEAGVNRLSIGIQSFRDEDLQAMNRSHNSNQALDAVRDAQMAGFGNISIDLIYGIPGSGMDIWQENVRQALDLAPQHLSAYALTVEPRTVLHSQVQKGQVQLPPDENYQDQYFHLMDAMAEAGWEHYELSNFARPGFRSRHNSSYWTGAPYLGLGPSAHSYWDHTRFQNTTKDAQYLIAIDAKSFEWFAKEELSRQDRINEYLMTHFRMAEGVDLDWLKGHLGFDLELAEGKVIDRFVRNGWMVREGSRLLLGREGKMMSDAIIRELFQVD